MTQPQITVLGVGNILMFDEGAGVRVAERLNQQYDFPDHVTVVDGGVLGVHLMGVISAADHLIVVDAMRNQGPPGSLYRLAGDEIPQRILAKNSLHQVDLLESLTLCAAIGPTPETVIIGIEPADIDTLQVGLTPEIEARLDDMAEMVLAELKRLDVTWKKRAATPVDGDPDVPRFR